MTKYRITYEDGAEKRELWFKDEYYEYSMLPNGYGLLKSDKPGLDVQYEKKYPDAPEELLGLIYELTNDNDVLDILEQLDEWECGE